MVSTRSRASESIPTLPKRKAVAADPPATSPPRPPLVFTPPITPVEDGGYERLRDERIKENRERMQKLGLFELSHKLKKDSIQLSSRRVFRGIQTERKSAGTTAEMSQRRSSRLKNAEPQCYSEFDRPPQQRKKRGTRSRSVWADYVASVGEFYTEEHVKLLGTYETPWTLFVDGCGPDGRRVYDQINGQTCHQCRQKTLGHRTHCSNCDLVQGQFCGDCLFMRYGENVLEANSNPDWICPPCRGICNCSICRSHRGWAPTGAFYRKAINLGFKSVAHYLILSRLQTNNESGDSDLTDERASSESDKSDLADSSQTKTSARRSLTFAKTNPSSFSDKSAPQDEPKQESNTGDSEVNDSGDCCDKTADLDGSVQNETNEADKLGSKCRKKTKRDLSLNAVPSPDSIAGRLRSRSKISGHPSI